MLGSALKEFRGFHQLTQKEVADQLGISKSYLSEIENNHKSPNLELLDKYSELFGVRTSSLLLFSERLSQEKKSDNFRIKCAGKLIKIMEWINEREEFSKRREEKNKTQNLVNVKEESRNSGSNFCISCRSQ